jgi:hypothetical protein
MIWQEREETCNHMIEHAQFQLTEIQFTHHTSAEAEDC